jgi:hypothetical protein
MAMWTMFILLAVIGGLIVWDIIVATNKERGDTISEIMLAASVQKPWSGVVFGLTVGILIGHLWWPQIVREPKPVEKTPEKKIDKK